MLKLINFSFELFGKRFISPWYIKFWGDPGSYYSNDKDYPVLLKIGKFMIKIPKASKMGGSHNTTTYSVRFFEYEFDKDRGDYRQIFSKEFAISWRIDTAWDNFDNASYLKFKRRQFEKKYPPVQKHGILNESIINHAKLELRTPSSVKEEK